MERERERERGGREKEERRFITLHAQHEQGKVIGAGVHIYDVGMAKRFSKKYGKQGMSFQLPAIRNRSYVKMPVNDKSIFLRKNGI